MGKGGRGGGRLPPEEGPFEGSVLKGGSGGGRSTIQEENSDVGVWGGRVRERGEAEGVMGREGWGSHRLVGLADASLLKTLFLGTIAGGREVLCSELRLGRTVLKKGALVRVGVVRLRGGSGGGGDDSRGGRGGRSPRVLPGRGLGGRGGGFVVILGGRDVLPMAQGSITGILTGSSFTSSLGEPVINPGVAGVDAGDCRKT